ncbi:hypothetical protein AAC387_Pa03g1523 [Persea americana]
MATLLAMGACNLFPHPVLCSYSTFSRPSRLSASYREQHTFVTSKFPLFTVVRGMNDIVISCSIAVTGKLLLTEVIRIISLEFNSTKSMCTRNAEEVPFAASA